MLDIGKPAPEFGGFNQDKEEVSLSEYLDGSKFLLLYFYPQDNTPGCTLEAQKMRDIHDTLSGLGVQIVGVSADSVSSHQEFHDEHDLPFDLVADPDQEIIDLYEARAEDKDYAKRVSYLLRHDGVIIRRYGSVDPETHAKEVHQDIKKFKASATAKIEPDTPIQ